MKTVGIMVTTVLAVSLASAAGAATSEAELAFRDAARAAAKASKADLATRARELDAGLRALVQEAAATGNLTAAVDGGYDLVLDLYAAAHGDVRQAATKLQTAGVAILTAAGVLAGTLPRAFQDGGNGTWDAHARELVKQLATTFARMEKLQRAFADDLARLAQRQDDRLVLNVTHAVPDLPTILGPVVGLGALPPEPGTKLRVLAFWTTQGSALGPVGMGGGVAEPGAGPVRVRLRGSGGIDVEQLAAVTASGRFEFWFGLGAAPGVYTVTATYDSGRPGGDALAAFVAGP